VERQEKFGAAHFLLLGLTLAFLAVLFLSAWRERAAAPDDGYRVEVERAAPAEELVPEKRLLDVNTATAEELQELMGIGPVLAQAIVDYRAAHGPFSSVDELLAVSGIGEAKLGGIREDVTVGGEP